MVIAIDFDGTLVDDSRPYSDTTTPLQWLPGAREAVYRLQAAGHTLLLWTGRTNRALLYSSAWDPLVRAGVRTPHLSAERIGREVHWRRYFQMLAFLEAECPGVFVVDDGLCGKTSADLYLDDKTPAGRVNWNEIAYRYGAPAVESAIPGLP